MFVLRLIVMCSKVWRLFFVIYVFLYMLLCCYFYVNFDENKGSALFCSNSWGERVVRVSVCILCVFVRAANELGLYVCVASPV